MAGCTVKFTLPNDTVSIRRKTSSFKVISLMTSHILLKSLVHSLLKTLRLCYGDQLLVLVLVFVEKNNVLYFENYVRPIHGTYSYHTTVFSTTDSSWFFLMLLNPVSPPTAVKCRSVPGRFMCLGPSTDCYHSDCLRSCFLYSPFHTSILKEMFALLACYAALTGSYRRFGTNYRSPFRTWRWDRSVVPKRL